MRVLCCLFVALMSVAGLSGCPGGGGGAPGCEYSGGIACEAAATKVADDLCPETSRSAYELETDCDASGSGWRDCWTACVDLSSSCDEAMDCQDACTYCQN